MKLKFQRADVMLGANLGKLESLMGDAGREEALAKYIGGASLTICL